MCQVTVAQIVLGELDRMEMVAIVARRESKELHRIEQSAFTQGQLAYASSLVSAIRQLKSQMPRVWRKLYVSDE